MSTKWYRTNEIENAINSLEHAALVYRSRSEHKWKWLMISRHGAVYGFAICALRGTNPDRVMKGQNLISPRESLRRCQNDVYMNQYVGSARLVLGPEDREAVDKFLTWVRDNLVHFHPHHWSLEISWLRKIIKPTLYATRFLALQSGNVRLAANERRRISLALRNLDG